jgi:hypothetical protein
MPANRLYFVVHYSPQIASLNCRFGPFLNTRYSAASSDGVRTSAARKAQVKAAIYD